MNTGDIEEGFRAAFESLGLEDTVLLKGADGEIMPHESHALVCDATTMEHTTRSLWTGTMTFRLSSPALKNRLDLHNALSQLVGDFLADQSVIAAVMPPGSFQLVGLWIATIVKPPIDNRWTVEWQCNVGLKEL